MAQQQQSNVNPGTPGAGTSNVAGYTTMADCYRAFELSFTGQNVPWTLDQFTDWLSGQGITTPQMVDESIINRAHTEAVSGKGLSGGKL
jgi:hypothetical protein